MPKKISDLIAKLRSEMPELEDNETLDAIEVAAYDAAGDEPSGEAEPQSDEAGESENITDEVMPLEVEAMDEGESLDAEAADEDEEDEEFSPEDFPMPKLNKKPKRQMA